MDDGEERLAFEADFPGRFPAPVAVIRDGRVSAQHDLGVVGQLHDARLTGKGFLLNLSRLCQEEVKADARSGKDRGPAGRRFPPEPADIGCCIPLDTGPDRLGRSGRRQDGLRPPREHERTGQLGLFPSFGMTLQPVIPEKPCFVVFFPDPPDKKWIGRQLLRRKTGVVHCTLFFVQWDRRRRFTSGSADFFEIFPEDLYQRCRESSASRRSAAGIVVRSTCNAVWTRL